MMDMLASIQQILNPLFPGLLGIQLTEVGPARVVASMEVRPELCTTGEVLHGGVIMAVDETLPAVSVTPSLQLLYTSSIAIAAPLDLGRAPYGQRRVIDIMGGAFSGPRLSGRVLPGGVEWQIVRSDGIVEVDARYTL